MDTNEQVTLVMRDYVEKLRQVQGGVAAQLADAIRAQQAVASQMQEAVRAAQLNASLVKQVLDSDALWAARQVASEVGKYQRDILDSVRPLLERARELASTLPPRVREAFLALAREGWYLDPDVDFTELWALEAAALNGDIEELDTTLGTYFEERLDLIESAVCEYFPNRKHIFSLAFEAHRRGEYALSIPVLLAQTDGMCSEVLDQELFRRRHGKPRTADFVTRIHVDTLLYALLAPLEEPLPINATEAERGEDFDYLNRHTVMHGESLDYGSRLNGLRAISLVNYVAQMLQVQSRNL